MRRRTALLAAGTASAVTAGAIALRRTDARWAGADDRRRPEERLLPVGRASTVITDDGAELAVLDAGQGPMVVLAHCWTGGREVWAPVAHRLIAGGHRVVLYDQRGHGSSTVGADGFTIPRLGGDLRAVLEAVDARDAVLAGHSMGGMTIQALAAEHAETLQARARAIVLVATAAAGLGRGRIDAPLQRAIASPLVEGTLGTSLGHALVRGLVGRAVQRNHLVLTRDLFCACAPETRSGWLSAMQTMDLREAIKGISMPVTVVAGGRDLLTPPSRAAELVEAIPGAELRTLHDAGHMLPLEAPDEVAGAIAAAAGGRTGRQA